MAEMEELNSNEFFYLNFTYSCVVVRQKGNGNLSW